MHIFSNQSKSVKGNRLNKMMKSLLTELVNHNKIKSFRTEPRYHHPNHTYQQFRPDFEITTLDDNVFIIDNTTTVRSDRLKQKQWDAFGSKSYFAACGKNAKYFVLVPDYEVIGTEITREKEVKMCIHEKGKIRNNDYFSAIDDIIQFKELTDYL